MRLRVAMTIMAVMVLLAVLALTATFVSASIFAKQLPTAASLEGRLTAAGNGFLGEVAASQDKVKAGEESMYDACVQEQQTAIMDLNKVWQETVIILEYYKVIEGSEEAKSNFDKWLADFESKYPKVVADVQACYDLKSAGLKEAL